MKKRHIRTLAALLIIAAGVFAVNAQEDAKAGSMSETERSVRAFFDSYAEDLRGHKREAIADRYDRRGVYLVGNGTKSLVPFDQVRERYLTKWSGPKAFAWKDLSVEVISKDSAVVTGLFEWTAASGTAPRKRSIVEPRHKTSHRERADCPKMTCVTPSR